MKYVGEIKMPLTINSGGRRWTSRVAQVAGMRYTGYFCGSNALGRRRRRCRRRGDSRWRTRVVADEDRCFGSRGWQEVVVRAGMNEAQTGDDQVDAVTICLSHDDRYEAILGQLVMLLVAEGALAVLDVVREFEFEWLRKKLESEERPQCTGEAESALWAQKSQRQTQ